MKAKLEFPQLVVGCQPFESDSGRHHTIIMIGAAKANLLDDERKALIAFLQSIPEDR